MIVDEYLWWYDYTKDPDMMWFDGEELVQYVRDIAVGEQTYDPTQRKIFVRQGTAHFVAFFEHCRNYCPIRDDVGQEE